MYTTYFEFIILCIIASIVILTTIVGIPIAIYYEKKDFNNGFCPKCGKKLNWFDTDSQGGRGYCCRDCMYYIWVSYNCVDKKYKTLK